MAIPQPSAAPAPVPACKGSAPPSLKLRLIITVPSILALFTIGYGLVSYQAFSSYWDELSSRGAGELAASLLRVHLTAMIVLTMLAVLIGIALTDMILRPLRSLIETAQSVGQGNFGVTAPSLPGAPEFEELSRSFNRMLQEVNDSIALRNRRLVDTIPLGVLTTDLEGQVTAVNAIGARLLGLAPGDLIGHQLAEMDEDVPATARPIIHRFLAVLAGPETTSFGSIELGEPEQLGVRRISIATSALRDANGEPWGILFSFRDAGAAENLSAHLTHTDHLAALGTLALGLAHELRNPLAAVRGLGQLLQIERDMPPGARGYLELMIREIDRVDVFVKRLLELGEKPAVGPAACDLSQLVLQADERVRRTVGAPAAARVDRRLSLDPLPPLLLEGGRVEQALYQIILNAYQATPTGGRIFIQTSAEFDDGGRLRFRVTIHNTGSTIAPADRQHVFEPFFTTREQATGLGLTYAHQIITQNGGELNLRVDDEGVALVALFDDRRTLQPDPAPGPDEEGEAA